MKVKPYGETHMDGVMSIDNLPRDGEGQIFGDLGIQIAKDGRVWICINGISFLRFTPSNKYHTVKGGLKANGE